MSEIPKAWHVPLGREPADSSVHQLIGVKSPVQPHVGCSILEIQLKITIKRKNFSATMKKNGHYPTYLSLQKHEFNDLLVLSHCWLLWSYML